MMKRILALALALIMMLTLCACKKRSGITVDELGQIIDDFVLNDGDVEFWGEMSKLPALGGGEYYDYSFSYKINVKGLYPERIYISGHADKNKNIWCVSAEAIGNLDLAYCDELTIDQYMFDGANAMEIPAMRLACEMALWDFAQIVNLCSGEEGDDARLRNVEFLLSARDVYQEKNGWSYLVKSDTNPVTGENYISVSTLYPEAKPY